MGDTEKAVYLEDIEVKKTDEKDENKTNGNGSATVAVTKEKISTAVTGKRQRTLMEMSGKAKMKVLPAVKKQKLEDNSSSSGALEGASSSSPPKALTSGLQPLNSIPFSMQAFKDSLSDDQKGLLLLECETMGKSW